ncbi:MAG: hypothetical protein ACYDC1_08905 [Limisphaerales bacterium]
MNRSVLVIICDFLLISLLSLASFDKAPTASAPGPEDAGVDVQAVQDMLDTLKQALGQEQVTREQIADSLAQTEKALEERQRVLAARESQLRALEQNLQQSEQRTQQIDLERTRLQQQQDQSQQALTNLEQRQAATLENVRALQAQLEASRSESSVSQARLEVIEGELNTRREEARRMQEQAQQLQQMAAATAVAKERLAVDLGSARTEANLVREQLNQTQTQVTVLSTEKARLQDHATVLAQGVDNLAEKSRELAQEVRSERTLTANAVYNEYLTNRLELRMSARRSGFLGMGSKRDEETRTVLFQEGNVVYALCHVAHTPLPQFGGSSDWSSLLAVLGPGNGLPLGQLLLTRQDPRLIIIPVPAEAAQRLGTRIYPVASDAAKFEEAVLVGHKEGYYGDVEFQIEPSFPQYLRMETPGIGRIFGQFAPKRGDLIFSKTGELLGLMVNNGYCVLIRSVQPWRAVTLGTQIADQKTSVIGAEIAGRLQSLPQKLK